MPHYYVKPANITDAEFILDGDEAHHLIHVLRVKTGDELNLFDGKGSSYACIIDEISRCRISGRVISKSRPFKTKIGLRIYQSVPKGERMDWVVEKLSELGILSIHPIITARSSNRDISDAKIERWRRLSLNASKQCGRSDILEICKPVLFDTAVKNTAKGSLNIIPWEGTAERMRFDAKAYPEGNIFIGPEGGFTSGEIELARKNSIVPVSLGRRILRVETASLLASILVLNAFNEFDV